jgi:hypothetical protein
MLAIQVSPSLTGNNTDTNEFGIRARVSGICDKFVVVALLKALDFATPPPNSLIHSQCGQNPVLLPHEQSRKTNKRTRSKKCMKQTSQKMPICGFEPGFF